MCDRRGPEKPAANHRSSRDPQPLSGLVIQVWHPLSLAGLNAWLYTLRGSLDGWHGEPLGLVTPRSGLVVALGEGRWGCFLQGCRKGERSVGQKLCSVYLRSCRACLPLWGPWGTHHCSLGLAVTSSPAVGSPAPGFSDGALQQLPLCGAGFSSHFSPLQMICPDLRFLTLLLL